MRETSCLPDYADGAAEKQERIGSLQFSQKQDRVIATGPFRLELGPDFDRYMMWGFIDNGVRFYASPNQKVSLAPPLDSERTTELAKLLGLSEQMHQSQLSCAVLADSKTLITAGDDSTISVWTLITTTASVDLQPRGTLFGHRRSINVLAVSRSHSALLSASVDGVVILWDLNRLDLVRILATGKPVDVSMHSWYSRTQLTCIIVCQDK